MKIWPFIPHLSWYKNNIAFQTILLPPPNTFHVTEHPGYKLIPTLSSFISLRANVVHASGIKAEQVLIGKPLISVAIFT